MLLPFHINLATPPAPPKPGQNPAFPYQGAATIIKIGPFFLWTERNVKSGDYYRLAWQARKAGASSIRYLD